jgi:hypothetical protein
MALTKERHRWKRVRAIGLVACMLLLAPGIQAQSPDGYHNFEDLTTSLRSLVRVHSDIAMMESIGTTLEGRDIWMVQIANREGAPVEQRPGLLISANLEGDHLVGSELALHTIEYLLTRYSTDAEVQARVDNHVFYIFPRLNPDGAETRFDRVLSDRRTNARPYDGDNDGRTDEDGPEDLNGDGLATLMRVADPMGSLAVHPDDARLLKDADAHEGEAGVYRLYWEGIDNDDDGFYNEDGPGGVDINRNFQHEYPAYERDAGLSMVSELESRALMDFVLSHRNIAMALTYGESDNLVSPPTSNGSLAPSSPIALAQWADESTDAADTVGTFPERRPPRRFGFGDDEEAPQQLPRRRRPDVHPETTVNSSDLEYFNKIGEKYRELTGIQHVVSSRAPQGAFFEYAYFQYGIPSLSTTGWGISGGQEEESGERPRGEGRPGRGGNSAGSDASADLALLRWMDSENIDGYVDWTEFDHPTLGAVEIGGFKPYSTTNPPAGQLTTLGASHAEFAVYLTSLFAQVRIAHTEVTNRGGGIFQIGAEIENAGYLPTSMNQGVTSRSVAPTMVQLGVNPEDVLTGAAKTSFFHALEGTGARKRYVWVIRGREGERIELKVVSQKGGTDTATITLR